MTKHTHAEYQLAIVVAPPAQTDGPQRIAKLIAYARRFGLTCVDVQEVKPKAAHVAKANRKLQGDAPNGCLTDRVSRKPTVSTRAGGRHSPMQEDEQT